MEAMQSVLGYVKDIAVDTTVKMLQEAISAVMQDIKRQLSFRTIVGDQAEINLYSDLKKFDSKSILGDEIYAGAQQMLNFGVSVEKVVPSLKMLADVSLNDKQQFTKMVELYTRLQFKRNLSKQDILDFMAAGWNPLPDISRVTGKKQSIINQDIENGTISTAMLTKALEHATGAQGKFYNVTERTNATPFGKWEGFKAQMEENMLHLGTALQPSIDVLLTEMNSMADKLGPFIDKIGSAIGDTTIQVADFAKPVINFLTSKEVADFVGGMKSMASSIVPQLKSAFSGLLDVLRPLTGSLGGLLKGISSIIDNKELTWLRDNNPFSDAEILGYIAQPFKNIDEKAHRGRLYRNPLDDLQKGADKANDEEIQSFLKAARERGVSLTNTQNMQFMRFANMYDRMFGTQTSERISGLLGWNKQPGTNKGVIDSTMNSLQTITGGGSKQVVININSPMYKVDKQEFKGGSKEGLFDFEQRVEEVMYRILNSLPE